MMTNGVKEKLEILRQSLYATNEYHNWTHAITIGGILIMKPSVFITKGKQMVGFILFQINQRKYETYRCQTFSKPIIQELLNLKNVCEINCLGRFIHKGNEYLIQIEEIRVGVEYVDIPLEPPYKKGE